MLDIKFRPLKDKVFDPLCHLVPPKITPLHITSLAFISGILSCLLASYGQAAYSLSFWLLNRALDCLDGALARHRKQASDLGGFLDLLGDFIIYSAIPICCALSQQRISTSLWIAISVLEATFHVNNFVLFFVGAVIEKRKAAAGSGDSNMVQNKAKAKFETKRDIQELTSVAMRPALVEGLESGLIFTLMLMFPNWTEQISWLMALLVCLGIVQRVLWLLPVL